MRGARPLLAARALVCAWLSAGARGFCPGGCSTNGVCRSGSCECLDGWAGEACELPAGGTGGGHRGTALLAAAAGALRGGGRAPNDAEVAAARLAASAPAGQICGEGGLCSGHGICDAEIGRCACDPGFKGAACEVQRCPGPQGGLECHGRGACRSGICECASGWGSPPGAPGPTACEAAICPIGCGDHGQCVDGRCVCMQGWQGPACRDPECPGHCSGHGSCSLPSTHSPGECTCDYGWAGAACQRVALYAELRPCPEDCSGNGLCLDGVCQCAPGFTGLNCDASSRSFGGGGEEGSAGVKAIRCPGDCRGQGLCLDGQCACWEAFTGNDCSVPLYCRDSCKEQCLADQEQSEPCLFCVGQCVTLHDHPLLGKHNPFEDLESTL